MSSSSVANNMNSFTQEYSYYTGIIVFISGIIGNLVNTLVFTQIKLFRNNRCGVYLIVEWIADIGYLITYFTSTILPTIYGYDPSIFSLVWCRLRTTLLQTCTLISASAVCFTAVDQFCSTSYRFHLRRICTLKMARRLTIVMCCISVFSGILFGYFYDIPQPVGCVISNPTFTLYSTIFYFPVLVGLLPIVISSLFSFLAFRAVRRIVRPQVPIVRRRLDRQMTAMVFMRVILFVFFRSPFVIYRVYAINSTTTQVDPLRLAIERMVQAIFNSFVALNYAGSFYLFMASSSRYRHQVKHVLTKDCWQPLKLCCYVNHNHVVPATIDLDATNFELK